MARFRSLSQAIKSHINETNFKQNISQAAPIAPLFGVSREKNPPDDPLPDSFRWGVDTWGLGVIGPDPDGIDN